MTLATFIFTLFQNRRPTPRSSALDFSGKEHQVLEHSNTYTVHSLCIHYVQFHSSPPSRFLNLRWARDRSSQRAALNVRATEIPVLRTRPVVTRARQPQHAQVEVSTVGRGACGDWTSSLGQRIRARGVPESNLIRGKILAFRSVHVFVRRLGSRNTERGVERLTIS
jgi:hypothetical protein